ncbi:MAG: RDD family protein [Acidobacteriaceae bacterium]|nr:RDD family protein [Acidobacteriaceae bacterium]
MPKLWRGNRAFHAHETARMDSLNGLPLASFKSRAIAIAIDVLLIAVARHILGMGSHEVSEQNRGSFGWFVLEGEEAVRHLIESTIYYAVALKVGNGQTFGKWIMKIRVVSLTHHGMGWWQSIERALGYGASLLEGGFGFLQYYINPNRMCVHDRIAETIVIDLRASRAEPALKPDLEAESALEVDPIAG